MGRTKAWRLFLGVMLAVFSTSSEARHPQVYTVLIKEMKFVPAQIQLKKGDVVVWINQDLVVHDVTEAKARAWRSPEIAPGKSWRLVAHQSVTYFCSFHPLMKGSIQIQN